ncbi:MAG: ATP-binding cassette domain-containing protein, partial [Sphaerochaeta sp.]
GRNILDIDGLSKTIEGNLLLDTFSLHVNAGDKIAFVGPNHAAKSALFEILSGNDTQDSGTYTWGVTTSLSYFPKNNNHLFEEHIAIVDWLRQYSPDQDDTYVRSFLGRMLFSGDEALKDLTVLSGGEKVRCLLSKMMLEGSNVLIFDEPTSHLDLEAITALNNGLIEFTGNILFNSHDHQFVESVANRIIEFTPGGVIDRMMGFEEYFKDEAIKNLRVELYGGVKNALAL